MSDKDFIGAVLVFGLICAVFGAGLAVGLPWLWEIVKPILHTLTA